MMAEPFTLTYAAVIEADRLAWEEGRLGYQDAARAKDGCMYRYPGQPGCGCAIGVALPPDVLDRIEAAEENVSGLYDIADHGFVICSAEDDARLHVLQAAHDDAVRARSQSARHPRNEYLRGRAEHAAAAFERLIGVRP
jgi:hypothetical protein